MEEIKTRDGSVTFHNADYDEAYHSRTVGAIEEAMEKYVKPAKINDNMAVLDFCFGLGYNSLAALYAADKLRIVALEHDRKILAKIKAMEVPERFKDKYELIRSAAEGHYYHDRDYTIKLFLGDAKVSLIMIKEKFDAVFFDPFSPKKCPELWTEEVFRAVYKLMKKGARLTTYSCATHVRENMRKAGLTVKDGVIFGRKSPSTIAIKE